MQYKDIWHPSPTDTMDLSTLSKNQADSINDKIEEIKREGLINVSGSPSETFQTFFNPDNPSIEGTAVWDTSLGSEVRALPIPVGGETPGSQNMTGMVPIPIRSVVPSGNGSSFKLDGISGVKFNNCNMLYLNNIFTPEFDVYKVYLDITSAVSDIWYFSFSADGVGLTDVEMSRVGVVTSGSTISTINSAGPIAAALILPISATISSATIEVDIFNPLTSYYYGVMARSGYVTGSTQGVSMMAATWKNNTATPVDGLWLRSNSNNNPSSGYIKIYGYANSDETVAGSF